ncbi:hypothetical protein ACOMHN_054241 [Nucella lapillus]
MKTMHWSTHLLMKPPEKGDKRPKHPHLRDFTPRTLTTTMELEQRLNRLTDTKERWDTLIVVVVIDGDHRRNQDADTREGRGAPRIHYNIKAGKV